MSQVDKSSVHDFTTGETVTEAMLDQNTEVLRVAHNDTDNRVVVLENAQAGNMTGIRSGTAFPTSPVPKTGDKFYRTDQHMEYTYTEAGAWEELSYSKSESDSNFTKGTGKRLQSGKTSTLTVPAGQITSFDYTYPTPYASGVVPEINVTRNGSIANCADLEFSTTNVSNTGFRLELKNKGAVDEWAFFHWHALG